MEDITGFQTATTEELPDAVAAMDHFNVVRLAGDAVDRWRRRVQQETRSHRGRTGDSLYAARRTLHTGADLLTDRQRLAALFDADEHVEVQAPCGISYQRAIIAYREPDRSRGWRLTTARIESLSRGVPAALAELIALGADPDQAPPTFWLTSTDPAHPTVRPRRSTAAWNTCADRPSGRVPWSGVGRAPDVGDRVGPGR